MSRSTRLRARTIASDTNRAARNAKDSDELDTYGLVEENGGRPFQLIEGLSSSVGLPQYKATLTHPLSVRDSAVLYSSMLSSRRTWISSEMFDMLWSKQFLSPSEKERLEQEGLDPESVDASAAREKMHKLCDCVMFGGPHAFSVRLFIVKNEETENKWNEAIEQKKRSKEDRKKRELEDKKKKQEERKQQQWVKKQGKDQQQPLQLKSSVSTTGAGSGSASSAGNVHSETKKQPVKRRPRKEETPQPSKAKAQTLQNKKPLPQSTEDQKMITNLNLMAQKNQELNSLMIIVAGGRSTSEQVEEFKKYIEKARKMPTPPGWKPTTPAASTTTPAQKSSEPNITERKIADKSRPIIPPELPTSRLPDASLVKLEDPSKVARDVSSTNSTSEPRQKRKYTKRKNVENPPEPEDKSMQLTTFQQKYMHNADIVFEYVENPNKRFSFPKDAILELLEDGESYIMSWIIIHNRKEVEKYKEKRCRNLKKTTKGESDGQESSEVADEEYDVFEDLQSPAPLYTTMTVKLTNIHRKFQTIMINSVNPADKVRKRMSNILERGTRLTGYNLWFQLDAYDDSDLAESLRSELKDYEAGFRSKRQRKQF
ncbi:LANO_0D09054g1_1 [Lachancea nothofagi CBS 11611]|uniref:LANO_0D09054g1_1 n=1 Tax=Lachancea nothofagi CBS 11611 TaxID=1266666 RepID=A0A1G4JJX5_9SACH|nr:LANO_0D09054g1_1 [Lachancea nothofagi CBS 11611]